MRILTLVMLVLFSGCIGNTPPSWDACTPASTSTHMSDLETLTFACTALDADADVLTYTWLVDGTVKSAGNTFTLTTGAGIYTVEVRVSDGSDEISKMWSVWVIESVDVEPLIQSIEEIRGLKFKKKIEWKYFTRSEFAEHFSNLLEENRRETEEFGKLFTAIHIWDPEKDYFQEFTKSSANVMGVYNFEEEAFYEVVVPGVPLAFRKLVVLEELVHALSAQYSYADVITKDQKMAFNALVEGDAALVKKEYLRMLPTDEFLVIQNYSPEPPSNDADPLVMSLLLYPYDLGKSFAQYLLSECGWEAINSAYTDPPDSTEQIIHPEKFLAREPPILLEIPDISGWDTVVQDVLGEELYSIILRQHLPMDEVEKAVTGWGGDRCSLFERGDDYIVVLNTAWDTVQDAEEFLKAYLHFTQEWSGNYTVVEEEPGRKLISAQNTYVLLLYSDIYVLVMESDNKDTVEMAESLMEVGNDH